MLGVVPSNRQQKHTCRTAVNLFLGLRLCKLSSGRKTSMRTPNTSLWTKFSSSKFGLQGLVFSKLLFCGKLCRDCLRYAEGGFHKAA